MTFFRLSAALGGLLLLVTLVSCSDPSGVGLGVGEDPIEGGDPEVETVTPDTFYTEASAPTTGLNGAQQTWRFLAGAVSDYGRVRADGYFDVQAPGDIPTPIELAAENPDSLNLNATLRLTSNYVHGDTSEQVSFQLHDLANEAEMEDATADESFDVVEPPIQTYDRSPTDSSITLSLPNEWVQDNAETLTGDSSRIESDFHGFRLSAPGGEAVVGFEHGTARLELSLAGSDESVTYLVEKSFSQIERPSPPSPPADHVLLQDGTGDELVMEWDQAQLDSLRETPLNRAAFIIPTNPDTASLDESFVRPSPDYRIAATREEGAPSCGELTAIPLTSEGDVCGLPLPTSDTGSEIRVDERSSFTLFERILLQDTEDSLPPTFSEYRTRVVDRPRPPRNASETVQLGLPSTLPVLIPTPGADTSAGPRVELTVTPL